LTRFLNPKREVIDFLLYLKNKTEQELYLDPEEEAEIWNLIKTEERIPSEKIDECIGGAL